MTLKTEIVQRPSEVEYYICDRCKDRVTDMHGMMEARWYESNSLKNNLIDLLMPSASPEVRNQFAGIPRATPANVLNHLCKSCAESYQAFVNSGKFNEFMESVRSIALKLLKEEKVSGNELMDTLLKYGMENVTHPKQPDSGKPMAV